MPQIHKEMIRAVVGLGNPGKEYENTRHNVGFKIIDEFLLNLKGEVTEANKYSGIYCHKNISGRKIHFLKPMTFMNLSGNAVQKLADSEELKTEEILIIHDDMDFELGNVRLKMGGGSAGHNGIESIMSSLQTGNFARLRIGIGRSGSDQMRDHVLDKFREDELEELKRTIKLSLEAIKLTIARDISMAMNVINANRTNNNK